MSFAGKVVQSLFCTLSSLLKIVRMQGKEACPVLVQEGFALHEHVVLAETAIEKVADAGVVGNHQSTHSVS